MIFRTQDEITKKFMEIFNIKPKRSCYWSNTHCKDCNEDCVNFYIKPECPQITSDILLKLMCLVVYCIDFRSCKTPEDIRDLILSTLIYNKDYIDKSKVQSLFTGVEESIHNGDEKLNKTLQEIKEIAENERLKAECEMYKTFYRAKHDDIKGLFIKYRTCLQEIKTIAEHEMKELTDSAINGGRYLEILNIIKKAEEEEQ